MSSDPFSYLHVSLLVRFHRRIHRHYLLRRPESFPDVVTCTYAEKKQMIVKPYVQPSKHVDNVLRILAIAKQGLERHV